MSFEKFEYQRRISSCTGPNFWLLLWWSIVAGDSQLQGLLGRSGQVIARCEPIESVLRTEATGGEHAEYTAANPGATELPEYLMDLYQRSTSHLSKEQAGTVRELLLEFQGTFSKGPHDLGHTSVVQHTIDTGDAPPIRQPPRRLPFAKREEAFKAISEMREQGIIEPSASPWASPVVLVKKKDGSTRFCVDYRKLNTVTRKDSYPLPRIEDILDTLSGSTWFSTLDLASGYWQVEVDPSDREKTAFTAGNGLWQYRVMPFGLCNAPATFERLMEGVLGETASPVYLDDIITHANSFEAAVEDLRRVFTRLRAANLKLKPKKCMLLQRQVSFLGHVVSGSGVATDPEKVDAVKTWPTPRNVKEIRSFLGLCTYYRRFVPSFADLARPLHQLTEKARPFLWSEDCEAAFTKLKEALTIAPILSYPTPDHPFILDTDASDVGIGAVLSQIQNGQERVIAYFSRTLTAPERNYCVTRRELLAIVKAVEHFHVYLYGRKFTVRSDHSALQWLLNFRNPEGQTARWLGKLQCYDFLIQHRPGSQHQNADAMSRRRPCAAEGCKKCQRQEERDRQNSIPEVQPGQPRVPDPTSRRVQSRQAQAQPSSIPKGPPEPRTVLGKMEWTGEDVRQAQLEDPDIGPIHRLKAAGERPRWQEVAEHGPTTKAYWGMWDSLRLVDGVLYRLWESPDEKSQSLQLVLPEVLRAEVLKHLHDDITGGHLGVNKTLNKVRTRFYWANCRRDVAEWCSKCDPCAARKGPPRKPRAPLSLYNVGSPMERVAIDILGPLPESDAGNKYLLIAMDYFSKWPEGYALPNMEAQTVADALLEGFFSRFGMPLELHSDQGRNFESTLFKDVCDILGIRKTRTTPLHPQSDGMVERFNRTIENQLTAFVSTNQRDWDKHIPLLLLSYRTAVHETTKYTPAMLMFGRELHLPLDLIIGRPPLEEEKPVTEYAEGLRHKIAKTHEFARANIKAASEGMKRRYDARCDLSRFDSGDLVWLFNPQRKKGISPKLSTKWEGPYTIQKRINDVVYRIRRGPRAKAKVVHRDRLWRYRARSEEEASGTQTEGEAQSLHQTDDAELPPTTPPLSARHGPTFGDFDTKGATEGTPARHQLPSSEEDGPAVLPKTATSSSDGPKPERVNADGQRPRRSSRPRRLPARFMDFVSRCKAVVVWPGQQPKLPYHIYTSYLMRITGPGRTTLF